MKQPPFPIPETADAIERAFLRLSPTIRAGDCPPPEALWAASNQECSPKEQRRIVLHIAQCPACAADWRLARSMQELSLGSQGEGSASLLSFSRRQKRRLKVLAASLCAAALGLLYLKRTSIQLDPSSDFRGNQAPTRASPEGGRVQGQHFDWTSATTCAGSRVLIYDGKLDLLFESDPVYSHSLELSNDTARELKTRNASFWSVRCVDEDAATTEDVLMKLPADWPHSDP